MPISLQSDSGGFGPRFGRLRFWLFLCLPDSACANESQAEWAGCDEWNIQINVNPTQFRDLLNHHLLGLPPSIASFLPFLLFSHLSAAEHATILFLSPLEHGLICQVFPHAHQHVISVKGPARRTSKVARSRHANDSRSRFQRRKQKLPTSRQILNFRK